MSKATVTRIFIGSAIAVIAGAILAIPDQSDQRVGVRPERNRSGPEPA